MVSPRTGPGNCMPSTLNDDDRRAVDLLLDQPNDAPPVAMAANVGHRLKRVEQVLGLLNHLPAPESPADLVHRTLQRIDRATTQRRAQPAPVRTGHPAGARPTA